MLELILCFLINYGIRGLTQQSQKVRLERSVVVVAAAADALVLIRTFK